jgi:hypothetical protein
VRDGENGRLLPLDDTPALAEAFAAALGWVEGLDEVGRVRLAAAVAATAERFSLERTARQVLELYDCLRRTHPASKAIEGSTWAKARRRLGEEWRILRNIASAVGETVLGPGSGQAPESLVGREGTEPRGAGGSDDGRGEP